MPDDRTNLRRRLERLGRRTPAPDRSPAASDLPPGHEVKTAEGVAFFIERRYPLEHRHGPRPLAELFQFPPELTAEVAGFQELSTVPLERLGFLDTETTGLAGGAGTLVFLIGIGYFVGDDFRLRQYFLRDPGEEAAMLRALEAELGAVEGFVTFNGRAFDLPLLESRYVIGLRERRQLTRWPHLDLLFPARRLWRRELPNCRLSTLEREVLAVQRTDDDVPGAEIPGLYLDYLRTGNAAEMTRVLYHNAVDVLSLVGLTTHLLYRHSLGDAKRLTTSEALGLARWHQQAGRNRSAEAAWEAAEEDEDATARVEALRQHAAHLKRQGRLHEAMERWEAWHTLAPDDPYPCAELAKAYEWQIKDLAEATAWAQAGLVALSHWPPDWRRDRLWGEFEHRLARLARKLAGSTQAG